MVKRRQQNGQRRTGARLGSRPVGWVKQYVLGLGLGAVSAVYGLIALLTRHAFLPGLRGGAATVAGNHGVGVGVAYLVGGVFLVCRFFLHPRCRSELARGQVYLAENFLLIVLIAALVYVLLKVGTAG